MRVLAFLLCLFPLAPAQVYIVSTVAGNGRLQLSAGGSALGARLILPSYIAEDSAGNLFVSDGYYDQVFRISAAGIITAYVGTGVEGFSGDGQPATAAQIRSPQGLAVDSSGALYLADSGNGRVRKVTPDGVINTVAGGGSATGDGGKAVAAAISVLGVALDQAGNLYFTGANVVRKVDTNGIITTVAGTGKAGFSGDGSPAPAAQLFNPQGIALDTAGNLYVAEWANHRVRKINSQGIITTFAGNGKLAFAGDGQPATSASLAYPSNVALDAKGDVYIADGSNGRVRMVNPAGVISTVAGGGSSVQNGAALQASLVQLIGLLIDNNGNLIVVTQGLRQVRQVTPQGAITTIAGLLPSGGAGDNIPATASPLLSPYGVAADGAGNLYLSDITDNRIRKVNPAGLITTVAGTGLPGNTGDGGPAVNAQVGSPRGLALDSAGNLYFPTGSWGIRKLLQKDGTIATAVGNAQLTNPLAGVAVDAAGNIYIPDLGNQRILRVDASGTVTTIAGTGVVGFAGDNGPAAAAQLFYPQQIVLDSSGNLYFADSGNNRVRKITAGGTITTVAGNGLSGAAGDGGPATAAQVFNPTGVALDAAGNLYIASGNRIRKVDASTGTITTIAGTGSSVFSGDGGLATVAGLSAYYLTLDASGNIYFTDTANLRVRELMPAQIVPQGVANGATLMAGPVAPGEIVTIYGANLGPASGAGLQLDASGRVATQLAGTRVLFNGVAAPLTFLNSTQVNAVVPYEVAGEATAQLQLTIQGKPTNTISLPVAASSPGVFAITNPDGTVNSPSNPALPSGVLVLYGTGEGQTTPTGIDGIVNTTVFPKPQLPVSVQIGGQSGTILYAGAGPGFVSGVLQVNVQVPSGVSGVVPLQLQIGNATTPPGLTISVRAQ